MSLREFAATDANALISLDGDDVVLTAPASLGSTVYRVAGNYSRVGVTKDAEGIAVLGDTSAVTISLVDLADKGLADPELLKTKGWALEARGISYLAGDVLLDRTLDVVTMILKRAA